MSALLLPSTRVPPTTHVSYYCYCQRPIAIDYCTLTTARDDLLFSINAAAGNEPASEGEQKNGFNFCDAIKRTQIDLKKNAQVERDLASASRGK